MNRLSENNESSNTGPSIEPSGQAPARGLDSILSESDVSVKVSRLKEALQEVNPTRPQYLPEAVQDYINDLSITPVLRYLFENGISITFKKVYSKLKKNRRFARFSTIWDYSTEQYFKDGFKMYWETLEKVHCYQNECITQDRAKGIMTFTLDLIRQRDGKEKLRGLLLGCIESEQPLEVHLYRTGLFESMEVMDIAGSLLERQHGRAVSLGMDSIKYTVCDLNEADLKHDFYDFIWSWGTIHHIENLEALFDRINGALKNNGLFVYRDYAGPTRLQFSDRQLSLVNGLLMLIPEEYKRDMYGGTINHVYRPSLKVLIRLDPSEAIRSSDIIPVITERLNIEELRLTGGTILHPLLGNIASNFEKDPYGESLLEMLIDFERHLIQNGEIPSDYIFCVAGKKH